MPAYLRLPGITCFEMSKILQRLQRHLLPEGLIDLLATGLSGADFNSLLLDVFQKRAAARTPADLLRDFDQNRFVTPAKVDVLQQLTFELAWLQAAAEHGFEPQLLSPVSPLGTCSAVGTVSQNKVLSGVRGVEVTADASNVLALKIAHDTRQHPDRQRVWQYAAVHRHLRTQQLSNPAFSAHFTALCLVSGGFDRGGFGFELEQLNRHIGLIVNLLGAAFPQKTLSLKFLTASPDEPLLPLLQQPGHVWSHLPCSWVTDSTNRYYHPVQFKVAVDLNGQPFEFADGGLVDWTQQLLANRKHRALISGVGIELVQKLRG